MEQTRDEKVIVAQEPKPTTTSSPSSSESIKPTKEISPAPSFDETMRKDPKYDSAVDEKDLGMKESSSTDLERSEDEKPVPKWKQLLRKYKWVFHVFIWMLFTA